MRLDKWLWAARFFKTRAIAKDAIESSKVKMHGASLKPSTTVKVGQEIVVRKGAILFHVTVKGLSENRLSAPLAQELYEESEEGKAAREQAKIDRISEPETFHRPDKKQRRQIRQFKLKDS